MTYGKPRSEPPLFAAAVPANNLTTPESPALAPTSQSSPDLITGQAAGAMTWKERALLAMVSLLVPSAFYGLMLLSREIAAPEDRGATTLIAYGLLSLPLAAMFVWYARRNSRKLREHVARSVVVPGEVLAIEVSGIRGDSGYSEKPTLRFTPREDGEPREVAAAVSREKLTVGARVQVRYDPQDADWAIVDGRDPDRRWLIAAVGGVMVALGVIPIVWGAALVLGN